jgi:hypothetical protein
MPTKNKELNNESRITNHESRQLGTAETAERNKNNNRTGKNAKPAKKFKNEMTPRSRSRAAKQSLESSCRASGPLQHRRRGFRQHAFP